MPCHSLSKGLDLVHVELPNQAYLMIGALTWPSLVVPSMFEK